MHAKCLCQLVVCFSQSVTRDPAIALITLLQALKFYISKLWITIHRWIIKDNAEGRSFFQFSSFLFQHTVSSATFWNSQKLPRFQDQIK